MKKNLKINLLALTCFGLSAKNQEISQADFIKKIVKAVADYGVNGQNSSFENIAYLSAALYQTKDSSLKIFVGDESDIKNLVINSDQKMVILKGKKIQEAVLLEDALKEAKIEKESLVSKVENYVNTLKDQGKYNKKWWIIGSAAALLIAVGAGYYLYSQNQSVDI